jgi:hypothetical protein
MSRAAWVVTGILAVAFLLMPGIRERWRRVRRAVGALLVFWVSMNLWGVSLHLSGFRPDGSARAAILLGPPLLAAAAFVFRDLRRRPEA